MESTNPIRTIKPTRYASKPPSETAFPIYFDDEPSEWRELRGRAYQRMWEKVTASVQKRTEDCHQDAFEAIHQFVSQTDKEANSTEVPIGLLVAGVNIPDHRKLFVTLRDSLKEKGHRHVVVLRSIDCSSLQVIISYLSKLLFEDNKDEGKDDKYREDLEGITEWYHNLNDHNRESANGSGDGSGSGSGSGSANSSNESICILVEDLEGFKQGLLEDFIYLAGQSLLPFVFVIGTATNPDIFWERVGHSLAGRVNTQTFRLQKSVDILDGIIDTIFVTEGMGPVLGGKVLEFLLDQFLLHNFTIESCSDVLRLALIEFFSNDPMAFLLLPGELENVNFTKQSLEYIRRLPSVRRYVESLKNSKKEQRDILLNDAFLSNKVTTWLGEIAKQREEWPSNLATLLAVLSHCSHLQLSKREVLLRCLQLSARNTVSESNGNGSDSNQDELLFSIQTHLKQASVQNLTLLLETMHEHLHDQTGMTQTKEQVKAFLDSIEEADTSLSTLIDTQVQPQLKRRRAGYSGTSKTTTISRGNPVRLRLIQFFTNFITEKVGGGCSTPAAELVTFNRILPLKKGICPNMRKSISNALNRFESSIGVKGDTAVAFKTYLQAGRLINLHDWYIQFSHEFKGQRIDPGALKSRFAHATGELQLMGFIKPTGKKEDHVTKLVFEF